MKINRRDDKTPKTIIDKMIERKENASKHENLPNMPISHFQKMSDVMIIDTKMLRYFSESKYKKNVKDERQIRRYDNFN